MNLHVSEGRIGRHLRSNVVGYLALLVALGGTSYAAASLPRNSVASPQIKNGTVRTVDVKDRSLLAKDFKQGQLPRGATGATGATGARGPVGPSWVAVMNGGGGVSFTERQTTNFTFGFTVPQAGEVAIEVFLAGPYLVCNPVGSPRRAGLFVDDEFQPGTAFQPADSAAEGTGRMVRAIVELDAGAHTAAIGVACDGGSWSTVGPGSGSSWRAQLVG